MDAPRTGLRVTVRVRPGSSRDAVGGRYGDPGADALVVAVTARAVEGAATRAVLEALARAFGVRARDVTLVAGERSRTKIVSVAGDPEVLTRRLSELLGP